MAPHTCYSHLSTCRNTHIGAVLPDIRDGHLTVPDTPGWGMESNEETVATERTDRGIL